MVPLGAQISGDSRCQLVEADFFARVLDPECALGGRGPAYRYDAMLIDIDHSPDNLLDREHSPFYQPGGLIAARSRLKPGGVFGLWSDDAPSSPFMEILSTVFEGVRAEVIRFDNPYTNGTSAGTVYLGHAAGGLA